VTVPSWLQIVLGVAAGVLLLWLILVVVLLVQQRRAGSGTDWRGIARLVPDVVRLIKRLAADRDVPRPVRWWLLGLLVYLLLPIDLIPDFLPVIGYADDAIITAIALRFAIRRAGYAAVQRNWPGTPEGLASVLALARIRPPGAEEGAG
jgi:uncharacterized membrane protein YkvA (DUF1232 family)